MRPAAASAWRLLDPAGSLSSAAVMGTPPLHRHSPRRLPTGVDDRSRPENVGQKRKVSSTQPLHLSPFERIFEAADGVLNFSLKLIGVAFRLQLGVADRLADRLLDFAFDFLRRSDDPVLVHDFFLERGEMGCGASGSRSLQSLPHAPTVVIDLDQPTEVSSGPRHLKYMPTIQERRLRVDGR